MDIRIWKIGIFVFVTFSFALLTVDTPNSSASLIAVVRVEKPNDGRLSSPIPIPSEKTDGYPMALSLAKPPSADNTPPDTKPSSLRGNENAEQRGAVDHTPLPRALVFYDNPNPTSERTAASTLSETIISEKSAESPIPMKRDAAESPNLIKPKEHEIHSLGSGLFQDRRGVYRSERALVTAYCPCEKCCGFWAHKGLTSTGKSAWTEGAAADPLLLPYGTQVFIPDYGITEIDDTGGAMRSARKRGVLHIDVRMTYHYEARQWGSRYLYIRIYQ
jgi:3D (Asp-Asp-Asp) domain-containing protein